MNKGVTVWFTGLSGAGKTTISRAIEQKLKEYNVRVEVLDGDLVRESLTSDLGFSKEDRQRNIERVSFVSKLLARNDVLVLASFITPYQYMRDYARKEIGTFIEVYVKCSLEECIRRDAKGLYKKALAGEIDGFTGISDIFEVPPSPDLILDTEQEKIEECAQKVLNFLHQHGYITFF